MKLFVYHAEHRCAPCRDMHARIDEALATFASQTGLDGRSFVEYIDVDANPELAPADMTVVPHLFIDGVINHHGRISSDAVLGLLNLAVLREEVNFPPFKDEFSADAPSGPVVFYRTYSRRKPDNSRESYAEMVERVIDDIVDLGELGAEDDALVRTMAEQQHALPSGRWLWVGGTEWIKSNQNYSGAYNCTNTTVNDPEVFGLMMELAMMGSGTGAILEQDQVAKLPPVMRRLTLKLASLPWAMVLAVTTAPL